jgi:putative oxidoreductase
MCVAGWVGHRKNGFFIIKDGWEYVFVLAVSTSCLVLFGPGSWSLDNALGIEWSGIGWFAVTTIGGIGAAIALLLTLYRPDGDE